jgi:prepilin signal peptidase PulO-like enzyme (type II secretory pathway)
MTTVILFVFGAIVGSFLNVVGTRYNSGITLGGRSFCPKCGHSLRWYELVPLLSFLIQGGRCVRCRAKISYQYPLVEIFTGLVFVTVPPVYLPVFCIYIAILVYDLRHKIIPDALVYAATLLAIVTRIVVGGSLLDWLAGPILFIFFALVWLVTQGRAVGFGDAKLSLSSGILLGAAVGFSGVIMGFWIGAVVGVGLMLFSRKKITMKSEVPFAPFLIVGAWLALIFNLDLLHVTLF